LISSKRDQSVDDPVASSVADTPDSASAVIAPTPTQPTGHRPVVSGQYMQYATQQAAHGATALGSCQTVTAKHYWVEARTDTG